MSQRIYIEEKKILLIILNYWNTLGQSQNNQKLMRLTGMKLLFNKMFVIEEILISK